MKKNLLSLIVLLIISSYTLKAQNLIAVQSGGNASFYTSLDSAIANANSGDYIYLSGGNFSISVKINKCLHLIGAGHHPDSADVTSRTIISGYSQVILDYGADNGSISGIYFNDPSYYGYENIQILAPINGYNISRCFITKGISINSTCNNFTLNENIICNLYCSNSICANNIFYGVANFSSSIIKNNIFTFTQPGYSQYAASGANCIFENNIFKPGCINLGNGNIYHNNLNAGINGIYTYYSNTNQGSGNILDNIDLQNLFINYNSLTFDVYGDFQLPIGSPYKTMGRDGTDIGLYGGSFPWKDGSMPVNPHIIKSNIGGVTNTNGALPVNIKVSAQDH